MISFKNLKKEGVMHGISEVKEGSFNFYTEPNAFPNFKKLLKKERGEKAKKDNFIGAEQIHGKKVHTAPPGMSGYIKLGVDGLISETPGQVLIAITADCLPILIYNPVKKKVAVLHAGRKGIKKQIIREGVLKMEDPSSLLVGVGPHIKKCCYSFEKKYFKKTLGGFWEPYVQEKEGKVYLDLTSAALEQLERAGVKKKNVEVSKFCTFCHAERFFSARKEAQNKKLYEQHEPSPETGSFIALTND